MRLAHVYFVCFHQAQQVAHQHWLLHPTTATSGNAEGAENFLRRQTPDPFNPCACGSTLGNGKEAETTMQAAGTTSSAKWSWVWAHIHQNIVRLAS